MLTSSVGERELRVCEGNLKSMVMSLVGEG